MAEETTEGTTATQLMQALQSTLGRSKFLNKAGLQYGNKRDIYKVAGYPETLTFEDYWALYKRGDIAGRLVDMQPQTTWRTPPEVIEEPEEEGQDPERTPFVEEFESLAKRLRLWSRFERVDRLCGVGRYAVLLIGVRGEDAELSEEMPELTGPDDVLYVSVYHEGSAKVKEFVKDPQDPRFGLPRIYEIDLSSGMPNFPTLKARVHASRVIHVAEDRLEDEVFGTPRLERVFNRIKDLEKVTAATGESFWQLASRILQGNIDPEAEIPDGLDEEMTEQLEEIIHDLRRIFVGQGVDLKWLESTPPDPSKAADLFITLIAGARGIPKRMLVGSETGERASTEDQKTYLGTIEERIERFAEPDILRAFIDRLVDRGALPEPEGEDYTVVWPSLAVEDEGQKAEANKARAEAAKALTPVGGDPYEIIEVDANRDVWLRPTLPVDAEEATPRPGAEEEPADDDLSDEPPADVPEEEPEDLGDVPVEEDE